MNGKFEDIKSIGSDKYSKAKGYVIQKLISDLQEKEEKGEDFKSRNSFFEFVLQHAEDEDDIKVIFLRYTSFT